jgi:multidrug efflux pump subunit AcrA (membrane-fusion protein)
MSALSHPVRPQEPSSPQAVPPPARPKRPIWKPIAIIAVVIVAGAAVFKLATSSKPQGSLAIIGAKTMPVAVGNLVRELRVPGVTSARNFANLTAPIMRGPESGQPMILLQLAKAGSLVKKGDLIATIDSQGVQDHVDDIKDTILQASNDVRIRQAEQAVEWENLQQSLRVAKANLEKARFDAKASEVRSDIDRELFQLAIDEADARYKQAQNELAFRKQSHEAEIKILNLTLERHRRHVGRHVHDLERFTIHAPIDGLVVMNSVFRGGEMTQIQLGDQLYAGQPFMKIVDPHSMQVEGNINQAESSELRIGQSVSVGLDAFPGTELKGKVYSIGALAVGGWRQQYFVRNVPVRIAIEQFDARVIPDLSAFGDVQMERIGNVVQVPLGAIHEDGGKSFLFVRAGDGFDRRAVTLGPRNNTSVAITSGVNTGDEVRVN